MGLYVLKTFTKINREGVDEMISKYFAPFWCWFFGHDKYFPHPNKKSWHCARCENSPSQRWDKALMKNLNERGGL